MEKLVLLSLLITGCFSVASASVDEPVVAPGVEKITFKVVETPEKSAEVSVIDGQEVAFVLQEPGKMSGHPFSASNEDRKALPQSVYNWVLNNLGPSKNCTSWVQNFCAEDFNLVSYEAIKDSKQYVILQRQFTLKQERMVYYVLSSDGELQQMQMSRDEKVIIKPTSSIVQ